MCGIAGVIDLAIDEQTLERMLKSMRHRGPDGNGRFLTEGCCLLHARLAIIDPLGGAQPMCLSWTDEEYVITYNGELYNTEELRSALISCGHSFFGHSDTEVLLHGYAQWGEGVLQKLNGIYAFAVWEKKCRRLFVARDRIGVKPLFYKLHDGGFLLGSEIKTILAYPTVKAELTMEGMGELILLGPGRTPGSGVLRDIRELEPGCCGIFEKGKWTERRYWKLKDREHAETFEETAECVRWLVTDAIRRQTVSDVPIGTFLSGGLDSSLISAICGKVMQERGEQLQTFSVDYKDNDRHFIAGKFQPDADSGYIPLMQAFLMSRHRETVLTPEELLAELDAATKARDLPGMADVDFSLLAFCRQIRKHVKVALSGECADEIFGGYPWYRDPLIRNKAGFPWAQNTKERAAFLNIDLQEYLQPEEFVMSRYQQTVDNSDILPGTDAVERRMKEMVNLNQTWFMQTLLDRKDRMSMYCGLEVRVPFCDHRIAEYLYGVPWNMKDYRSREKGLLRYAMEGILPREILYRKKSPYPKTHDPHYAQLVKQLLQELLQFHDVTLFQFVRRDKIRELLEKEVDWPWYGQLMREPQTMVYFLQINRWLQLYNVSLV